MARKKAGDSKVRVGNITRVSGKVTIAGRDVYEGYTVEQVSLLLKEITTNYRRKPFDGRCPYKGLEVFEEEDADLFFGRERLVDDLVSRVKESRTVFITGPSGSGKSSLVRAGLIHSLRNGALKGSERWLYETMKPGREPIKELSLAFSRLKGPDLTDYFLVHANDPDVLHKCAESVLSGQKTQRFVLFIDQFEEVFTQISQEEECQAFINMLAHAGTVENGRVIVLFAMRSDFVSNCATYPALNELLSQEFRQIGAMQPEELVAAIALPAKEVGLPVEEELIAQIINDMKGEPGALPLMQFALKDLFDAQQAKGGMVQLTLADYLLQGGIQKSLERHADASLAALDEKSQDLARSIFSGLIEIGRGTQDTKRTALFDELVPANASAAEVLAIVQKLADARLIITDEQAGKDTVTISHEKLIEAWPWLKKLVNENRDVIALQNEITGDANEWEDHQRDVSYLYSGARLINATEQLKSNKLTLNGTALVYIRAGQARQRRSRLGLIGAASIVIALLITAVIVFRNQSTISAQRAIANQELAQQNANIASTAQAASTAAVAQAEEAQNQSNIALARQLAAQAQSINATRSSNQMIAALLAVRSMKMIPSFEAAQVLQNNLLAKPIAQISLHGSVESVAFGPDGKWVVSGGCTEVALSEGCTQGIALVSEFATGKEIARVTYNSTVWSVVVSPNGKWVASAGCDEFDPTVGCVQSSIHVWNAKTGEEVTHMNYTTHISALAFSPNGKWMASSGDCVALDESFNCPVAVQVWDAMTGKEIARTTHNEAVNSIRFSQDGEYVVTASVDSTARVWVAATGQEISHLTHDFPVNHAAFSPDGVYVVSGSSDNTVRVWEAATGKEIARMTHGNSVQSVAFSPDGQYIVSGSWDRTARIWKATTGTEIARLNHDDYVWSVAFSPDGKSVVSASEDHTARVWDVSTGQEIVHMTHDDAVRSVAFSPDGNWVVSGGCDTVEATVYCTQGTAQSGKS